MNEDERTNDAPDAAQDSDLRELALLLLTRRQPGSDPTVQPQLLVGQLPPNYPFEVPLPEGSRIVGSFFDGRSTVVIETNATSTGEVLLFYLNRLREQGWNEPDRAMGRHGGFLPSSMAGTSFAIFVHGIEPFSLHVSTFLGPRGHVLAHLDLHNEPRQTRELRRRMHPDIWDILPPIEPPVGAKQFPGGGSGGSDRVETGAYLETTLDLPALATHYTQQLAVAGWAQTEAGEAGPAAWSTWTFQDNEQEPWRGMFFILKRLDVPQRYTLHLEAEWTGSTSSTGHNGSGWIVSSHIETHDE